MKFLEYESKCHVELHALMQDLWKYCKIIGLMVILLSYQIQIAKSLGKMKERYVRPVCKDLALAASKLAH